MYKWWKGGPELFLALPPATVKLGWRGIDILSTNYSIKIDFKTILGEEEKNKKDERDGDEFEFLK